MNEMRSKELHRHMMQRGTPQFSFYSSGIPAVDDNGRQHTSNLFLNHGRVSLSDTDSIQCEFRSTEENILQSSYGPTQNELRLKDCEMSESECKKLRRRLFDLELPADAYMNDEEEGPGLSGVSAAESYLLSRSHAMTRDRDGNLSIHTGVNSGCIGDVPNMRYPHGWWRNLNEPIKLKEASSSALTDVLGNNICSKEELERQVLSSNSNTSFQCLSKFSQDSPKVREIGVSLNSLLLETQRRQKGSLANNTEAGKFLFSYVGINLLRCFKFTFCVCLFYHGFKFTFWKCLFCCFSNFA